MCQVPVTGFLHTGDLGTESAPRTPVLHVLCATVLLRVPQLTEDHAMVGGPEKIYQLQGAPSFYSDITSFVRDSCLGKGFIPRPKVSTQSGLVLPPM